MTQIRKDTADISILYVEDDPEARDMVSRTLAHKIRTLRLYTAENGDAGMALYREHRPDIVITDINMPTMDGIRMGNEIKALNPEAIIIAVTAFSDTRYLLDAIETGISNYVLKPIDYDKLIAAINKGIETVTLKRQVREQNDYIRQLSRAVEDSPCTVLITTSSGVIEYVNPKFTKLTGYSSEEAIGLTPRILKSGSMPPNTYEELWATITSGREWRGEFLNRKKNGEFYWESASISPIFNDQRSITHFVAVKEDITDRKRAEKALRESERFLSTIIDTEPECVKMIAPDGTLLMMNPAGLAMIQADSFEQVQGQCVYPLIAAEHRESFITNSAEVFQGRSNIYEFEIVGLKGRRLWLESRAVPFRDEQGEIISLLSITRDITVRKLHEEELRELSLVDELTGLTNRRGFMLLARQQMKVADRDRNRLALMFADLDEMKAINDTFGHSEGDRAIMDTATILRNSFRASDIVARLGGDEFVALSFEDSEDVEELIRVRLMENFHSHNLDAARPYKLSVSFGISVYDPDNPVPLEELIERGDQLMYRQKRVKKRL